MCRETMDATSELMKIDYLRQTTKLGSKLSWNLLRVSTKEDEAFKPCRATTVRKTNRKRARRELRRTHLAQLAKLLEIAGKKDAMESVNKGGDAVACTRRLPTGAMAPENTTQYLMSNVYEDMKTDLVQSHETWAYMYCESLSPNNVYAALDSGYESCLDFQQRDFEETFGHTWEPE